MGRRNRRQRRTPAQAASDRAADAIVGRVGKMLREGRIEAGWTLEQAAARAGISSSTWSRLEIGADGRTTFATVNRAAAAVGRPLHAYLERTSAAAMPRDAVHLAGQELVMRLAQGGGWSSVPEFRLDADPRTSRMADLVLRRGTDWALAEIFDWFEDVGGAARAWQRRLDALERHAIARMVDETLPRVSGLWVVRATQRNRQLVRDHHLFFRALFQGAASLSGSGSRPGAGSLSGSGSRPGAGSAWLDALTRPGAAMPAGAALLWVTVKGDRVYPARLG